MTEYNTCKMFDQININTIGLKEPVLLNNGNSIMYPINTPPLIQIGDEHNMKMLLNPKPLYKDMFYKENYIKAHNITSNAFLLQNLDPKVILFLDKFKAHLFRIKPLPNTTNTTKMRSSEYIIFEDSVNMNVLCKTDNEIIPIEDINIYDRYSVSVIVQFVGMVSKKFGGIDLRFKIVQMIVELD